MLGLILVLLINTPCSCLRIRARSLWERDQDFCTCWCDFGSRIPCLAFVVVQSKLGAELFRDVKGKAAYPISVCMKSSSGTWHGETFSAWVCQLLLFFGQFCGIYLSPQVSDEATVGLRWDLHANLYILLSGHWSSLCDRFFRVQMNFVPHSLTQLLQKSPKTFLYFWGRKAICSCCSCCFLVLFVGQ